MFRTRKGMVISVVSGITLVLAVAGVWLFGATSTASAAEVTADDLKTLTRSTTGPGLLGDGYLAHGGGGGRWGFKGGTVDYRQLLADALGIAVEDLEAAFETARTKAIEQAVAEGLITQERADEILVWDGLHGKGFRFFGFGRGPKGVPGSTIDENALLAEALGISVEELRAAREAANQKALEQAVAEGLITQEQVDQMQSHRELMSYIARDSLLAKALGISVEELEAAFDAGKTLSGLMSEHGLDAAALREKLAEAHAEALAQAVQDGVITQEQADEMQNDPGPGFGGRGHSGKFGGRGSFGGHPWSPGTDQQGPGGMRFRRPGRITKDNSTL